MNEKRFQKMDTIIDPFPIWDTVEEKGHNCTDTLYELVELMNELYGEMKRFGEHNYKLEQYNLHYLNENTRLKEENEQLKHYKLYEDNKRLQTIIADLKKENEQLRKKLECCEYEHFKKELDKIHEKVEKGDLSDFCTLTISDKGLEHWNGVLK